MPRPDFGTPCAALEAVRGALEAFVRNSPQNRHHHLDGAPIFDAPLVGVAAGNDPLFERYRQIIGPFHLTPAEVAADAWGLAPRDVAPESLAVLCWALPITAATRISNRPQVTQPSDQWAYTRYDGEAFNDALREYAVSFLEGAGHRAVAPFGSTLYHAVSEGVARPPVSTWSERHALYAAGLGTFSINDGFITPRGIAMRCGSVITDLPLPSSPRIYDNHYANCLYMAEGTCGACMARCPAGAITPAGHDKARCSAYMDREFADLRGRLDITISGWRPVPDRRALRGLHSVPALNIDH